MTSSFAGRARSKTPREPLSRRPEHVAGSPLSIHSMTVAYLAQTVGQAIGADTQLLRIGAYYHDIGKMMNPKFFIENQFKGDNPHDVLEPGESGRIIIKHVRHGMRIGQESGLPKVVVDLISQHHGTQLMEYFYNIAVKSC